ncbi:hypothetical protein PX52LOC_02537 [Limnoglobus roseus]|uniref:Uncharacterized protein n=1 Tax=Limnoglobus roseus TaxID=2598579 RepID=A0A5C1AES0_9BACT|nr:hypothetical protein PX52LOC_02537 [Limnoglobus roseus]
MKVKIVLGWSTLVTALSLVVASPSSAGYPEDFDERLRQTVRIDAELNGLALKDLITQLEHDHAGLKFVVAESLERDDDGVLDRKFTLKHLVEGCPVQEALNFSMGNLGLKFVVRDGYVEIRGGGS